MEAKLDFPLTEEVDLESVFSRLEQADTEQSFFFSSKDGILTVSASNEEDVVNARDSIRKFVLATVGDDIALEAI
ncbi:hypothetical protein H6770_03880 [Candidatus Peribacteria bacterium]|nr:hypothetical protein [Candidatus Peribacteria bacterium]